MFSLAVSAILITNCLFSGMYHPHVLYTVVVLAVVHRKDRSSVLFENIISILGYFLLNFVKFLSTESNRQSLNESKEALKEFKKP